MRKLTSQMAGVITFLLTTFFIDRILQRSQRARQAPLRRLALVELLHALADEDHSQLMRGILRVRQLPEPTANSSKELAARTKEILSQAAVGLEEKLASHTGHQTELAELAGAVTRANAGIKEWANQLEQALLET